MRVTYGTKLSSVHIIAIMEHLGKLGRMEVPVGPSVDPVTFSRGFRQLFDLNDQEPARLDSVARAIHALDRSLFVEDMGVIRQGHEPPPRIYRLSPSFMTARYVAFVFMPLHDEHGEVKKFFGLARDVSVEEVRARHKSQNARRISVMMDYFGAECVWSADKGGQLFEHFTSGHLDGVLPTFDMLLPDSIHPDDRDLAMTEIAGAMATGDAFSVPLRIYGSDGVARKYVKRGFPLFEQGRLVEWWGVIMADRAPVDLSSAELEHAIRLATGATIRSLCGLQGWTHEELAQMTGISRTTIYRMVTAPDILLGQFKHKTVEAVLQIFACHGVRFFIDPQGLLAHSCSLRGGGAEGFGTDARDAESDEDLG
ncbi:helix-turn-helix domain-containing protein [Asticcacaulis endophyticus]|uniref:HTH cro/C1-type domain-containing protein n=1 Tax=Asticcacaulis endophyticus TaxID=1395890 RepID=A0A918UTZ3_9CAUL|nr:helix-turn-helix domain-containing protein [Asticcacaulis endophyticus]GGZ32811.1 hypothetical protein GCM10011273_18850 [Asticcacaulis endophyticus]